MTNPNATELAMGVKTDGARIWIDVDHPRGPIRWDLTGRAHELIEALQKATGDAAARREHESLPAYPDAIEPARTNSTIENGICVTCDRPVLYDDGSEDPVPDDVCLRDKSYCTDRTERVDWRARYKAADATISTLRAALKEACEIASEYCDPHRGNDAREDRNRIVALKRIAEGQ